MIDQPIQLRGRPLVAGGGPFIFGVLNVTPDSFSDGGLHFEPNAAVEAGCRMADAGADAIDVGGESTRPGSEPVGDDEQIARTQPVIAALARRFGSDGPAISIDTRSAAVARAALDAGATIINDVAALRDDPDLAPLAAQHNAGLILMHMQGTPRNMQQNPHYEDILREVAEFLTERATFARQAGISPQRIILDPGIGFGKTTEHNLELLRGLDRLKAIGLPLMVGPSRKRFIGQLLGIDRAADRLYGTLGVVAACVSAGVECLRVHDVAACRQVADICTALR